MNQNPFEYCCVLIMTLCDYKTTIDIITKILTSIGTVGAVAISLYVMLTSRSIKGSGSISFRTLHYPDGENSDEMMIIEIVNHGTKPFSIANFSVKSKKGVAGVFFPDYKVQITTPAGKMFYESEVGFYCFPRDTINNIFGTFFPEIEIGLLQESNLKKMIKSLKFTVYCNVHQTIEVRTDDDFLQRCVDLLQSKDRNEND